MRRRSFLELFSAGSAILLAAANIHAFTNQTENKKVNEDNSPELSADLIIAGGGLGGCAAALAACRNGINVIMTEETDWIGGQVSQQGVSSDEHQWIETHGATASYRNVRRKIRNFYRENYPLTHEAKNKEYLNPGDRSVSRLCHEPRVAVAVLTEMMALYMSSGRLKILLEHKIKTAEMNGNEVTDVQAVNCCTGDSRVLPAPYSVGIDYYHIDLHPSCGGDNYIDFALLPFQIPLGALLPQKINNLLPANKNIGTTHISTGCYRLHPVEWSIGEASGLLVVFALSKKTLPRSVRVNRNLLSEYQKFLQKEGLELHWPV